MDSARGRALIAVDTNLLVYAHRSATPEHRTAREALTRAASNPSGWGVPLPCVAELWMVATHPSAAGRPSEPDEVRSFLDKLMTTAGLRVLVPGRAFAERLVGLATALDVRGARVFDLQIGLCAVDAGATELWTHDGAFVAPAGLRVHDPLGA